jgi:hypothetical protein
MPGLVPLRYANRRSKRIVQLPAFRLPCCLRSSPLQTTVWSAILGGSIDSTTLSASIQLSSTLTSTVAINTGALMLFRVVLCGVSLVTQSFISHGCQPHSTAVAASFLFAFLHFHLFLGSWQHFSAWEECARKVAIEWMD